MVTPCNLKKYHKQSGNYIESIKQYNDKTFTEYLNAVKKYITPASTILEIGFGIGLLSKLISEDYYNERKYQNWIKKTKEVAI